TSAPCFGLTLTHSWSRRRVRLVHVKPDNRSFDSGRPLLAQSPPRSARSWCVLSFVGEAIHHLLGGKSGDGKAADQLQAVVAAVTDKILRSENGSAKPAGKFLKPRRKVYRRARCK